MKVSRRTFILSSLATLSSLAGGALLWKKSRRKIRGKIMGASHERGHRLRANSLPVPTKITKRKIAIVGGGIAGLSAAWKLEKSGVHDFALLELENEVGGNSIYGENSVSAYPWGAHYVPIPGPEARTVRELFHELGIIEGYDSRGLPKYNELYVCSAPEERLYMNGHWQEGLIPKSGISAKDQRQYEEFFRMMNSYKTAKGRDGKRAFAIPLDESSKDPKFLELDAASMSQFLSNHGWDSEPLRWYVNYCCRDDYGCEMDEVSAWAGVHYFASRLPLASNIDDYEVLTWPEGNGWIVKALKQKLSAHILSRSMAYKIETSHDQAAVDYIDFTTDEPTRIVCDHVIFAAPRFTASHIIQGYRASNQPTLTYAPWMVANLTTNQIPREEGFPMAWDNVIYQSPSLGYVNASHQSFDRHRKQTVLSYYLPLSKQAPTISRSQAIAKTHEEWVRAIVADLSYAHPTIENMLEEVNVWIWGHAMVRPTPRFIWSERKRLDQRQGRIYFAHSDMSGISIFEEAQHHGVSAAEQVMKSIGHTFTTSL